MKNYLRALKPPVRTQSERLTPDQVQNNAGGYTFKVSDEGRFLRFLILGTAEGTYYAGEAAHTMQATDFVRSYAAGHGPEALRLILDVVRGNRAPKPDATLLALALVARTSDLETRRAAWTALPEVARTGTMLLHFLACQDALGGWGRLTRRGVARVYEELPLEKLALWAVKYRSRDGWAQADALRLSHPVARDASRHAVFQSMLGRPLPTLEALGPEKSAPALRLIEGHGRVLAVTSDAEAAALMRDYGLPIEAVPTEARGAAVYRAAMSTGGLTWLLRNLGNLSRLGLLAPQHPEIVAEVAVRLTDARALRRGRIHPLDALRAQLVYAQGRGVRGHHVWTPVPAVIDALQTAFSLAFGAVKPSGGRYLLALDVSGSMDSGTVGGVPGLTPRLATAAMSLVTARTEAQTTSVAFTAGRLRWPVGRRHSRPDAADHQSGPALGRRGQGHAGTADGRHRLRVADAVGRAAARAGRHLRGLHRQRDLGRQGPPVGGAGAIPPAHGPRGAAGGGGHDRHALQHRRPARPGHAGRGRLRRGRSQPDRVVCPGRAGVVLFRVSVASQYSPVLTPSALVDGVFSLRLKVRRSVSVQTGRDWRRR